MQPLLSGNTHWKFCRGVLGQVASRRDREWIRGAVDPSPFPGYIDHQLKRNSAALVVRQDESFRTRGIIDRLQ